ncbi:diacylglycerol/lipid kinase family protein [Floricoccus penangensis]|uniref:diacylglycerol/lipid kinase family protein n=1 Tax=Floricoccus penangensis TaxID=1859475 RepID=UPI00203F984F|nr:diacylglycerol kinase family protein [Floricoccus penangensis]URZ87982.1 diacylglycerol kinase family lipid kinase [Floricoccus penangensis]
MKYYLLINPTSGGNKGHKVEKTLCDFLDKNRIEYVKYISQRPKQEKELAREISKVINKEDILIIIGGDGTLSNAVNQLPVDLPFAYIPAGSGNDFASSLNISKNPIENFKQIQKKHMEDFYIIKYDSHSLSGYAINNIGIGFDAAIVHATNSSSLKSIFAKLNLGGLAYLSNAIKVLFRKKPFDVKINNNEFKNAFLLTVTTHPYFGGGFKIAPNESSLQNSLTLVELPRISLVKISKIIPQLLKGKHLDNKNVYHTTNRSFQIETSSPQPIQIDGEMFLATPNETIKMETQKRVIIK